MSTKVGAAGIISDDFYHSNYSGWTNPTWVETDANSVMVPSYENTGTINATYNLVLTNNNGDYWSDPSPVGNWTAPYVLQTAGTFTNGNFSVTAKIQVQSWGASASSFDDCGILVRDASNIVCCGLYRSSSTNFSATRDATGSSFAEVDLGAFASNPAPYWIRITRTGTTTFQGWYSLNGTNFIQISTDMTTANFTPTGTGMYVGSTHLNGAVNTVKFDYFMETNTGDFTANEDSGGTGPVGSRRVFVIT